METLRELYRIGTGPSSSHTMGPRKAAEAFLRRQPNANSYRVTLFSSLAATGRGHLTDQALQQVFAGRSLTLVWKPEQALPLHPNGLRFEALTADGAVNDSWEVYSVGGGALLDPTDSRSPANKSYYPLHSLEQIIDHGKETGQSYWEYVRDCEGEPIFDYLADVWQVMQRSMERGLEHVGVLPGGLGTVRRAQQFKRKAAISGEHSRYHAMLWAYALAVAEENAAGGEIVTAPTCGASGVLPAVLRYLAESLDCRRDEILRALATAGLIGNLVKYNASISGAEVGCQGEIGTACAMAAAAATQLHGGTMRQIEYAAEMGLEHHLGLTCDPVNGLVQIPCIERNAHAATRALSCCYFALFSGGEHKITFDEITLVMKETGQALPSLYRETAAGGIAEAYRKRTQRSG